jgi:hypothetical protein
MTGRLSRGTSDAPENLRDQTHFVICAPRSGSSWLQTALNVHPDVLATEHRLFGRFCEIWPNPNGSESPRITVDEFAAQFGGFFPFSELGLARHAYVEELLDTLIDALLQYAFARTRKSVLVDKITPYLGTSPLVLDRIARHFPRSRVVQLVRDGRDVAVSGVFDWITRTGHGTQRHAFFVEQRNDAVLERFFDDEALTEWARYWSEPIDAFESTYPDAPLIRYEDMKHDLHAVLDGLCKRFGVSQEPEQLDACVAGSTFRTMSGGREPGETAPLQKVRKGVVGDWRNYFTRHDGELFDALAGESLRRFGYSHRDEWYNELPEVLAPDAFASERKITEGKPRKS